MHFDSTDLRLFIRVAEESNLTRGAELMHLSLGAASARIKGLEDQTGVRLLYREARGVRLTPSGEAFVHHARGVLQQIERLRGELQEYARGVKGHVRLFANTTAVTDFLPETLARFLADNPSVNIDLQEKPNPDIVRAVQDGTTDIGIIAGQQPTEGLRAIHFSTDRLILVTPRAHRLARRKRVAFRELLDEDFVGMHEGSTIHTFLTRIVGDLGKRLKLRIQLRGFDAMCRMVETGVGIAIVPESAARRHVHTMRIALIELTDDWAVRDRYILVRDLDSLPVFARALVESLCGNAALPPPRERTG